MSIVQMDNFSIYGTNTAFMLNGIYAEVTSGALTADPDGISSGHVFRFDSFGANSIAGFRFVLPSTNTKVGMAARLWFPALPTGSNGTPCPFNWRNVSNSTIMCVIVQSTGRLSIVQGGPSGSIVATTTNPVITANGWYHIEALLDIDAETLEIRVEGASVLTASSLGLATTVGQVFCGELATGTGAFQSYYIKDFVVYNGDGSYNNDFLGSVIVYNLTPTSDVQLNWTPSVGSNGYSILDNIPPNDAQYITAPNPPPMPYICTLSDLPPDVTSVKALMTFARAAKTDGGDASLQVSLISDSTTGNGADRPITVAQTYWRDIQEIDPATSAPWLPSAVNAVEMELDRTT